MHRVKVYGPAIKGNGPWSGGPDVYTVISPTCITEREGLLEIDLPAFDGIPARTSFGRAIPARRATGPSKVIYGRGEWTKIIITELIPDGDDGRDEERAETEARLNAMMRSL